MNTKRRKIILRNIKKKIIGNRRNKGNKTTKELLSGLGIVSNQNSIKSLGVEKPQKILRSILNIF